MILELSSVYNIEKYIYQDCLQLSLSGFRVALPDLIQGESEDESLLIVPDPSFRYFLKINKERDDE